MNATIFFLLVALGSVLLSVVNIDIAVTVVAKLLFMISMLLFLLSLLGRYRIVPPQRRI